MNYDTQRLNDALDAAHRQIKTLTAERDELREALTDALNQACYGDGGSVDSMALSAYANGLRLLAKAGLFTIEQQVGRRVIGRWTEPEIGRWIEKKL